MRKIEDAVMRLKGLEQICTHLGVSDYLRASGDAEIFVVLWESIKDVREVLEESLEQE